MLRIEDTDRERSTPENVEQILDALRWLELDWDEGPILQSERAERHREALEALLAAATPTARTRPPRTSRPTRQRTAPSAASAASPRREGAVRLRVPDEGATVIDDAIRGETRFEHVHLDDPVIARADGSVLYNFAVAIDDLDAGITHVVRGEDHLSNTPKQLLVLEAAEAVGLGAARRCRVYAHLPLLHGPDGKKLSKRHGAASVQELRDAGYLPEAVRNYLALLGWGAGDDATVLSTEELVERFTLERVSRNPARFDEVKLRWLNGLYIRALPVAELDARACRGVHRRASGPRASGARSARRRSRRSPTSGRCAGFTLDGPADDPEARERWLGEEGLRRRSREARASARAQRRASTRPASRQALAGGDRAHAGSSRARSTSRCASRSPARRLAGHLRERRAARPRGDAAAHRPRARARLIAIGAQSVRARLPIGPQRKPTAGTVERIPRRGCWAGCRAAAVKDQELRAQRRRKPKATGRAGATPALPAACHGAERPNAAHRSGERHQNEGHGRRLTLAFEALEAFPALAESRNRLLSRDRPRTTSPPPTSSTAVESDVALIIAVLRLANDAAAGARTRRDRRRAAVEHASRPDRAGARERVRTFDFFERASVWDAAPERFRLHALATQHAADRLAAEVGYEHRDRLTVTSLLHDVGKLVLMHAYPGYPAQVHRGARTPEERIHQERRELGVDHALVGGVLARRWGLPASIATVDRAPPQPGRRGRGRRSSASPTCSPTTSRARQVSPTEMLQTRARRRARARGAAAGDVRAPELRRASASATSTPARCPGASSASCSGSPRARSTSRSPTSSRSPRARCAPTCTTSTASSAPSTAPRRC